MMWQVIWNSFYEPEHRLVGSSLVFHMTPLGLKYAYLLVRNSPGKIMAPCGQRQKVSDTSISFSLYLQQHKIVLVTGPDLKVRRVAEAKSRGGAGATRRVVRRRPRPRGR